MTTCLWQYPAAKEDDTVRVCGKEGHPLCKAHEFVAEVLAETDAVVRELYAERETAQTEWQSEVSRLRVLVSQADELTPAVFVKRIHELLPALHGAAMTAVVYSYLTSGRKEDHREELR